MNQRVPDTRLARARLESLARTVADLVDKASQNERILRRFQQFELQLLSTTGLAALIDVLLNDSLRHFQLDAVGLWLLDPDATLRELLPSDHQTAWPTVRWLPDSAELRELYAEPPLVRLASPPPGLFRDQPVRSAAMLPLVRQGYLIGSLHFGSFAAQRFSDDKSTDFIAHLGSIVGLCLENCVNQERLYRLSLVDVLTRVENRRGFQLSIATEIARADRQRQPLTLILVDLDHFKQINDCHGHPTGDRVLRVVAQEIVTLLRRTDHVCRYGGEEFALILPDCNPGLAREVAERIRRHIAALPITSDHGVAVPVSLSLGVTCWPGQAGATDGLAERLLQVADEAVYRAKSLGRNRAEFQALH